jgi:signal transduction histidine kinase
VGAHLRPEEQTGAVRFRVSARALDLLIVAAIATLAMGETWSEGLSPYVASIPLGLVQAGALAWRRTAPLAALAIALGALIAQTAAGVSFHTPVYPIVVGLVALYSLGQYAAWKPATLGLAGAFLGLFIAILFAESNGEPYAPSDLGFIAFLMAAPWLVGQTLHGRTREVTRLTEQTRELERQRQAAIQQERARIARELHDVIAHSLSVMVVQAGAAEAVTVQSPERAAASLRAVQETGRQALSDMARLLGILRHGGEELGLQPQPGTAELTHLVQQTCDAGVPVVLTVEGPIRPLPAAVELSAYRIVQEALTNVRKHALGARASVRLCYGPVALELEVTDDGAGGHKGPGGGHGLIGMGERVQLFGGNLEAGPLPGGGFRVRAILPLESPAA